MNCRRLLERRVLFFGGKGGVGKTTLACAYALVSADEGARTLLVSTDPAHSTSDALGASLGADAREVLPRLSAIEIDPEVEVDQYIAEVKTRLEEFAPPRVLRESLRQIDIARLSPGAAEAAIFDRFTHLLDLVGQDYDRVIFDTAPTGHTLRLLALPEMMTAWIDGLISRRKRTNSIGRMWRSLPGHASTRTTDPDPVLQILGRRRARFSRARDLLTNRHETAFAFVVTPERLPILETRRAVEKLDTYGVPVGAILVNRVATQQANGTTMANQPGGELSYLAEIDRVFSAHPILRVPLQSTDVYGIAALRRLIACLPVSECAR